jgi:hypothetical protein
MRGTAELGPFSLAARELQPMEVRTFRWWEDELASIKAAEAEAEAEAEKEKEAVAGGGGGGEEEEEEEEASGNGRAPKKRSITDLFAEAPAVGAGSGPDAVVDDEEEVLRSIVRRSKELRRKRRLEQAALASVAEEPETSAAGERRAAEGNFPRKVRGPAQPDPTRPTPSPHHDTSPSCSNVFILLPNISWRSICGLRVAAV